MSYDDGYGGSRETVVTPAAPELPEALRAAIKAAIMQWALGHEVATPDDAPSDEWIDAALTAAWPAVESELRYEAQQQVKAQIEGLQAEVARLSAGPDHAAELAWWSEAKRLREAIETFFHVTGIGEILRTYEATDYGPEAALSAALSAPAPEPPEVVGLVDSGRAEVVRLMEVADGCPEDSESRKIFSAVAQHLADWTDQLAAALGMEDKP